MTSNSHIVFDVDDGPKTIEDSRALLEEAYAFRVRILFRLLIIECLRHEDKIAANFKIVQELSKGDSS